MNKPTCLIYCLLLVFLVPSTEAEPIYPAVESNVSYGSVTSLGFVEAGVKLVYGESSPELQYGLLWLPDTLPAKRKVPLIILIHGGCWLNQYDIEHSYPLSTALAAAGYGVWSIEYRRTGDTGGGWPGSFEDIKQGITYAFGLKNYPLDLDQIVIVGHSAGGHLALLAAAEIQQIDAVVGLAAITDIVKYASGENSCQAAGNEFMGGDYASNPAAFDAANPQNKISNKHTLLLQGDIDAIVPLEQAQLPGATTVVVKGAGHFDWIHPGSKAYGVLLTTLEEIFPRE